jgi:putative membrane protein
MDSRLRETPTKARDGAPPDTTGPRLVYFAAERTLLSWVRAALGLMAFGFVVDRFELFLRYSRPAHMVPRYPDAYALWLGTALVGIGVVMNLVAAVRYVRFAAHYRREASTDPGRGIALGVVFTLVIAIAVSGVALFLLTMSG